MTEGGSQAVVTTSARSVKRSILAWIVAAFFVITTVAFWIAYEKRGSVPERLMRMSIPAPAENELVDVPIISPDGFRIVFPARDKNGKVNLWMRAFDAPSAHEIPGTEGAQYSFWSGDSRFIAFYAKGKLIKIDPFSGLTQALSDVSDERGGAWSQNGVILFSPNPGDGLYRISGAGGIPTQVTSLDPTAAESSHRFPYFLPDGKHFLFYVHAQKGESGVYIGSLDSKEKSFLLRSDRSAIYSQGYLLFQRSNTLFAQEFDPKSIKLSGDAIPLSQNIRYDFQWGSRGMDVSNNNLLAYIEGNNLTQLLWFEHDGNQRKPIGSPDQFLGAPSFSPDGKRFAIRIDDLESSNIWLYDTSNGNRSRLTFASSYYYSGAFCWSPDGDRILFSSNRTGMLKLYVRDTSGTGNDELLYESKNWCFSEDWSPDGQYLIFSEIDPKTKFDLWVLSLSEPKKAFPFLITNANEASARFSPDGKWIAYSSDESGRPEVYVQPFHSERGGKWQVSTNGGFTPRWSRDGKELFYLSPDNQIMSSEVKLGSTFEAAVPKPLFAIHPFRVPRIAGGWNDIFEPAPDGKSFAVNAAMSSPTNITVVLNWQLLLNPKK